MGASPPWLLNALLRPASAVIRDLRLSQASDKAYKAAEVLQLSDDHAIYRRLVSHWDDPSTLVLDGHEPRTLLDSLGSTPHAAATFEQWMMTADLATYLPEDIMVKVDRAAMSVGLETRTPFLDHRLVEFALHCR